MTERPILFSAPMVRALLAGTKTQTRRVLKAEPPPGAQRVIRPFQDERLQWAATDPHDMEQGQLVLGEAPRCPYGKPGDRLWVREAFSGARAYETHGYALKDYGNKLWYWADGNPRSGDWTKPKPSIHMPRALSRITLEVTGVRVERLNDISEADAEAEGVREFARSGCSPEAQSWPAIDLYELLWQSINGPGSWDANPWVWVVEFKRCG